MLKKWNISYNPFFFFPFLIWVVVGGVTLLLFTKEQLFFAINTRYTPFTDVLMYYITWLGEGWFIVILLLLLFAIQRFRSLWFVITAALSSIVPLILQQFLKEYFKAPRPHSYFHGTSAMHFLPAWPGLVNNSFPSGHSEGAFSFFCLMSLMLPKKYAQIGFVFFLLALGVCYSRIYLTAHFFEDVYAGSIIGAVVTTIIYSVMTMYEGRFGKKDTLDKFVPNHLRYTIIILAGVLLFVPFLGHVHLFDWDEINFAECAREMIVSKDYLRSQIDFMPFWEKPPLFIWMQVLAMKIFGIGEFAARFPNAMIGVLTLVTIFYAGKRSVNEKVAAWWVLLYAATWLPHFYFKSGIIDPTFNLLIFIAFFQVHLLRFSERKAIHALLAGLFLGLAVLTKGPAAILVAVLSFAVYLVINRGLNGYKLKHLVLIAICACVPMLLWLGTAIVVNGAAYGKWFVHEFITYQVRLFSTEDSDHGGPFYYHFIVLLLGCFPASIFLFQYTRKRTGTDTQQSDLTKWMWIFFWVVPILFSIVKTKIVHYSSLCYFPLTYLAALQLYRLSNEPAPLKKWVRVIALTIGSLVALLIIIVPVAGINKEKLTPYINDPFAVGNLAANVPWSYAECIWGILYLAGIWTAFFMMRRSFKNGMLLLCTVQIIIIQATVIHFTPKIEAYTQRTAIEYLKSLRGKNVYVHSLGYKSYATMFYSQESPATDSNYHSVRVDKQGKDMQPIANEPWLLRGKIDKPVYFICKIQDSVKYDTMPQLTYIGGKNGFVFFKRELTPNP